MVKQSKRPFYEWYNLSGADDITEVNLLVKKTLYGKSFFYTSAKWDKILQITWSVANSKRIRETWFSIHLHERLNPFCGQNFSSERSSERFSLRQRQLAVWLEILKSINPVDFQLQTSILWIKFHSNLDWLAVLFKTLWKNFTLLVIMFSTCSSRRIQILSLFQVQYLLKILFNLSWKEKLCCQWWGPLGWQIMPRHATYLCKPQLRIRIRIRFFCICICISTCICICICHLLSLQTTAENKKNDRRSSGGMLQQKFNLIDI